jgi:predicted Zn-dependent protease
VSAWGRLAICCVAALPLVSLASPAEERARETEYAARDAERRFANASSGGGAGAANRYLDGVLQGLLAALPDPAYSDCRVHLIKGATASAFGLPNCRLYVTTALFIALENQAQLGALLARELAHVKYQHAKLAASTIA